MTKTHYSVLSIASLFLFCLVCCTQNHQSTENITNRTYSLRHDSLIDIEKYGILAPCYISVIQDDLIIGSEIKDSYSINVITNGHNIRGISYGDGPNEIYELSSIRNAWNSLHIYDSRKGILSKLLVNNDNISIMGIMDDIRMQDDVAMVNDSLFLTIPVDKSYTYALQSANGRLIDTLAYFPPSPKGISPITQSLNNTGALAIMHSKKSFARCTAFDGGMDFFSFEDESLKHKSRYRIFDKSYTTGRDGISPSPTDETRVGYTTVKATDDRFYASFSGDRAFENPEGFTNEIHVFSSDGQLLARFILDCKFTEFTVSNENSHIYALVNPDKGKIAVFDVSSYIKNADVIP